MNFALNPFLMEPHLTEDTHLKLFSKKQEKQIMISCEG